MRFVAVESPWAGCFAIHQAYLQACIRDCFYRGEVPIPSHQLYTMALDDTMPTERAAGMRAGFEIARSLGADHVFYIDFGWSGGMLEAAGPGGTEGAEVRRIQGQDEWRHIHADAFRFASMWGQLERLVATAGYDLAQGGAIRDNLQRAAATFARKVAA